MQTSPRVKKGLLKNRGFLYTEEADKKGGKKKQLIKKGGEPFMRGKLTKN